MIIAEVTTSQVLPVIQEQVLQAIETTDNVPRDQAIQVLHPSCSTCVQVLMLLKDLRHNMGQRNVAQPANLANARRLVSRSPLLRPSISATEVGFVSEMSLLCDGTGAAPSNISAAVVANLWNSSSSLPTLVNSSYTSAFLWFAATYLQGAELITSPPTSYSFLSVQFQSTQTQLQFRPWHKPLAWKWLSYRWSWPGGPSSYSPLRSTTSTRNSM